MTATRLKPVDAVVVGTGIVGSILSKELADAGLKVVALERGRMVDPQHDFASPSTYDELKYDRHSDIFQDLSRETLTFRNNAGETALHKAIQLGNLFQFRLLKDRGQLAP